MHTFGLVLTLLMLVIPAMIWFYNKCWGLEEIEISTFIFFEKKKHICMKSSKIK